MNLLSPFGKDHPILITGCIVLALQTGHGAVSGGRTSSDFQVKLPSDVTCMGQEFYRIFLLLIYTLRTLAVTTFATKNHV